MCWNNISDRQRFIRLSAICLFAGTAIFLCYLATCPDTFRALTVWTATENDVEVEIRVIRHPSGQFILAGTFTPTRPQFYLYSKDLPKYGLKGLGRPTLLEFIESDSIQPTGLLVADRPTHNINIETLGVSFPVYPAGPVTLSLPFERFSGSNAASMEVAITYMACSEKTCLPPVIDRHISIEIPADFFDD